MGNIRSIFGGIFVILAVALVVAAVVYFFMSLIFAIWKPTDETKEKYLRQRNVCLYMR